MEKPSKTPINKIKVISKPKVCRPNRRDNTALVVGYILDEQLHILVAAYLS